MKIKKVLVSLFYICYNKNESHLWPSILAHPSRKIKRETANSQTAHKIENYYCFLKLYGEKMKLKMNLDSGNRYDII